MSSTHIRNPPTLPPLPVTTLWSGMSPFHAWHHFEYWGLEFRLFRQKNEKQYHQTEQHPEHLMSTKKSFPRTDSKHNNHQAKQQASSSFFPCAQKQLARDSLHRSTSKTASFIQATRQSPRNKAAGTDKPLVVSQHFSTFSSYKTHHEEAPIKPARLENVFN